MTEWMEYICDIIEDGALDRVCIVQLDRSTWIASAADFLLSHDEVTYFISLFEDCLDGIQIKLKNRWYRMISNDGISLHCEDDNCSETMCIAKTNHQLIIGTKCLGDEHSGEVCQIEIDWIRISIKEQGG